MRLKCERDFFNWSLAVLEMHNSFENTVGHHFFLHSFSYQSALKLFWFFDAEEISRKVVCIFRVPVKTPILCTCNFYHETEALMASILNWKSRGIKVRPPSGSGSGRGTLSTFTSLKFLTILAKKRQRVVFATVSPKHFRFPESNDFEEGCSKID